MSAKKIQSVRIERMDDDSPDLSYLGVYTEGPLNELSIDRKSQGDWRPGENFRYFTPAMSPKETGNPGSPLADYERMEAYNRDDWSMLGIRAVATLIVDGTIQHLYSGGLWGVESDSGDDNFKSIEDDELAALADILRTLGFDDNTVTKATKGAEGRTKL